MMSKNSFESESVNSDDGERLLESFFLGENFFYCGFTNRFT